jgi:hypothetical protein
MLVTCSRWPCINESEPALTLLDPFDPPVRTCMNCSIPWVLRMPLRRDYCVGARVGWDASLGAMGRWDGRARARKTQVGHAQEVVNFWSRRAGSQTSCAISRRKSFWSVIYAGRGLLPAQIARRKRDFLLSGRQEVGLPAHRHAGSTTSCVATRRKSYFLCEDTQEALLPAWCCAGSVTSCVQICAGSADFLRLEHVTKQEVLPA